VRERRAIGLAGIPNLLSIARALLAVPFVLVMLSSWPHARWWGAGMMIAGAITDKLDGLMARRYRMETDWGRVLDPLADKVASAAVVVVLLVLNLIPLWFVLTVLGRDVVILIGGIALRLRRNVILPSNETGKWAMGVLAAALFAIVVDSPAWLNGFLVGASCVMLAVSLTLYVVRFMEVLSTPASS
jgi:cardiolipin synthase (CMP-forming)